MAYSDNPYWTCGFISLFNNYRRSKLGDCRERPAAFPLGWSRRLVETNTWRIEALRTLAFEMTNYIAGI